MWNGFDWRWYDFIYLFNWFNIFEAPYVHGCDGCNTCKTADKCVKAVGEDPFNSWWEKAKEADGIILASPTHFANVSTEMKSLIDRMGLLGENTGKLEGKIGASIVAVRRGGAASVYDSVWLFFFLHIFLKNIFIIILDL